MLSELKKRELLIKAYKDLIERGGRPSPDEIREKIKEIGYYKVVSVLFFRSQKGNRVIYIHSGSLGKKFMKSLVFYLFPSGQVRHIPLKDIIDIVEPVYDNPFPRRTHNDQK